MTRSATVVIFHAIKHVFFEDGIMLTAKDFIRFAGEEGSVEVHAGCCLQSRENIMSEQRGWADDDMSKHVDFSGSPFWVTYSDGGVVAMGDEVALEMFLVEFG